MHHRTLVPLRAASSLVCKLGAAEQIMHARELGSARQLKVDDTETSSSFLLSTSVSSHPERLLED